MSASSHNMCRKYNSKRSKVLQVGSSPANSYPRSQQAYLLGYGLPAAVRIHRVPKGDHTPPVWGTNVSSDNSSDCHQPASLPATTKFRQLFPFHQPQLSLALIRLQPASHHPSLKIMRLLHYLFHCPGWVRYDDTELHVISLMNASQPMSPH